MSGPRYLHFKQLRSDESKDRVKHIKAQEGVRGVPQGRGAKRHSLAVLPPRCLSQYQRPQRKRREYITIASITELRQEPSKLRNLEVLEPTRALEWPQVRLPHLRTSDISD